MWLGGKSRDLRTGEIRLNLETYYAGMDQATHPSVIYFAEPWNGYRYWMAYTPYPYANGEEENPSVAASNDLYGWVTPNGMVNPIADNEETGCRELKDPHILYRADLDRVEIWYLGRVSARLGGDGTSLMLFRKYSYDGVSWSDYEIMTAVEYLSPTVWWDGDRYQMWSIGFDTYGTTGTLAYQESVDGAQWTEPVRCVIDGVSDGLALWHGAVTKLENGYAFVYTPAPDSNIIQYCESADGVHFTGQRTIAAISGTPWQHFYRPCLLEENGAYTLLYGVVTGSNEWYLSMSRGDDVDALQGITEADAANMTPLTSTVTDTHSLGYQLREVYHQMRSGVRFELLALIPAMAWALYRFADRRQRKAATVWSTLLLPAVVCLGYTCVRIRPATDVGVLAVMLISILEGSYIFCISDFIAELVRRHGRKKDSR